MSDLLYNQNYQSERRAKNNLNGKQQARKMREREYYLRFFIKDGERFTPEYQPRGTDDPNDPNKSALRGWDKNVDVIEARKCFDPDYKAGSNKMTEYILNIIQINEKYIIEEYDNTLAVVCVELMRRIKEKTCHKVYMDRVLDTYSDLLKEMRNDYTKTKCKDKSNNSEDI